MVYIIYNDLYTAVSPSQLLVYADDSECIRTIHNLSDCFCLQQDLDAIIAWSKQWNLKFNVSKCHHLTFGSAQSSFSYTMNGTVVPSPQLACSKMSELSSPLTYHSLSTLTTSCVRHLGLVRKAVPPSSNSLLKGPCI